MGHKIKRCQQAQRGEKDRDGKIRVNRCRRNSMPQADKALVTTIAAKCIW
jgi:hypothetical protein